MKVWPAWALHGSMTRPLGSGKQDDEIIGMNNTPVVLQAGYMRVKDYLGDF